MPRPLPFSEDAEKGLLGSALVSNDALGVALDKGLRPETFVCSNHAPIFQAMWDLHIKGEKFDLVTFCQHLRDTKILPEVGGDAYVTSLFTFVPNGALVEYYAEILLDKQKARDIIAAARIAEKEAFDTDDPTALLDKTEQSLFSLREASVSSVKSARELVPLSIEIIERAYENKGALMGVETGLHELDRMTGGLQNGEMIVVAGRPSMGKTAIAMNFAEHATIDNKLPVLVFSLEMTGTSLMNRMISSRARVNQQKLRDGFLAERDFPAMTAAASKLAEAPLYIDDSTETEIHAMRARARRLKKEKGIGLVVIDYVQLARANYKSKEDNRQREVTIISSQIKGMAKELNIPVIAVCQLNRRPEERGGRPRLGDLRESGSLEQDADTVLLLYRPEIYEEDEEARAEMAGEATLIIAKQRNGPVGEVHLTFLKEFTRFEDRARNFEVALAE